MILLGVNVDHVATLRNARGGDVPDPVEAALIAEQHGADGITAHLREDRRHMKDEDMTRLRTVVKTRLNMEMAATDEMIAIACQLRPDMVTLVPERREERTTEGGLDIVQLEAQLTPKIAMLIQAGIPVSLFIEPKASQVEASQRTGAQFVELHTGEYAEDATALGALMTTSIQAHELGLRVNAGHGLTYENVGPILKLPYLEELNIGHNIICRAIFAGLGPAVTEMKNCLQR